MLHLNFERDAGSRIGMNIIDRLSRLVILLAVLFIAAAPKAGMAQVDTLIFTGNHTPRTHIGCSPYDDCCDSFQFIIRDTTVNMQIVLIPDDSILGDSCMDHLCWESQSRENIDSFYHDSQFVYNIFFDPTNQARTGPFPDTFKFQMCSPSNCLSQFPQYGWFAWQDTGEYSYTAHGTGYLTLCTGDYYGEPCYGEAGCDYIQLMDQTECDDYFCFHHPTGGLIDSFTINFSPPLTGCEFCSSNGLPDPVKMDLPGWICIDDKSGSGNIKFEVTNELYDMGSCGVFCFTVPKCLYAEEPRTITITEPDPCPFYITVNMKKTNGESPQSLPDSSMQNYPNPLDASTGFRTTVPFVTSAGGVASITITDEKGVKVSSESEDILGAGQHFFYFSASDLPSGIYYYTIEFPQGVVITNKIMLVVK